ncbi:GNAT family N-acetyltransferase, partial [Halolamina salina]
IGAAGWYVHDGAEGEDPVARFTHVGVRPDAQGEGVGAELVRAVVDRCPLPDERIVVCATSEHVGFYESVGFARIASLWRFARLP